MKYIWLLCPVIFRIDREQISVSDWSFKLQRNKENITTDPLQHSQTGFMSRKPKKNIFVLKIIIFFEALLLYVVYIYFYLLITCYIARLEGGRGFCRIKNHSSHGLESEWIFCCQTFQTFFISGIKWFLFIKVTCMHILKWRLAFQE